MMHVMAAPEYVRTDWVHTYPDAFAALSSAQRRAVQRAIDNGVQEGWNPTADQVAWLCRAAIDKASVAEFVRTYVPTKAQ